MCDNENEDKLFGIVHITVYQLRIFINSAREKKQRIVSHEFIVKNFDIPRKMSIW